MQNQEKIKKLLIIIIALGLFGASYYYYVYKQKKTFAKQLQKVELKQPAKKVAADQVILSNTKDPLRYMQGDSSAEPQNEIMKVDPIKKVSNVTKKVVKKVENSEVIKPQKTKIKPTDKAALIKAAAGSRGKYDPFSYAESNFIPSDMTKTASSGRVKGLPAPPRMSGQNNAGNGNYAEIRGFLGNKVIAEINGFTDSLKVGETLRGIKILSIDSKNLTCELEIDGKKVTKKMNPVNKSDKNVEVMYK